MGSPTIPIDSFDIYLFVPLSHVDGAWIWLHEPSPAKDRANIAPLHRGESACRGGRLGYIVQRRTVVGVAQSVRAPGCGPGGRGFNSRRSPLFPGAAVRRRRAMGPMRIPPHFAARRPPEQAPKRPDGRGVDSPIDARYSSSSARDVALYPRPGGCFLKRWCEWRVGLETQASLPAFL